MSISRWSNRPTDRHCHPTSTAKKGTLVWSKHCGYNLSLLVRLKAGHGTHILHLTSILLLHLPQVFFVFFFPVDCLGSGPSYEMTSHRTALLQSASVILRNALAQKTN